jgi:hypothetical protein
VNEGQTQIRDITWAGIVVERPLFFCGGGLRDSDHARTKISRRLEFGSLASTVHEGIPDPLNFFLGGVAPTTPWEFPTIPMKSPKYFAVSHHANPIHPSYHP